MKQCLKCMNWLHEDQECDCYAKRLKEKSQAD
jgi:hypothetical protein